MSQLPRSQVWESKLQAVGAKERVWVQSKEWVERWPGKHGDRRMTTEHTVPRVETEGQAWRHTPLILALGGRGG